MSAHAPEHVVQYPTNPVTPTDVQAYLDPCKKPACTGAAMQMTQESPSSSSAPPGTAPAELLPGRAEADAEKGWGCTKPPLGLVSLPSVAEGGGPDASCPDPQALGSGGAETAWAPLSGEKGLPREYLTNSGG